MSCHLIYTYLHEFRSLREPHALTDIFIISRKKYWPCTHEVIVRYS